MELQLPPPHQRRDHRWPGQSQQPPDLEGRSERVNLAAHIKARQSGGNTDTGGNGTMMHDRSDGSTMVGYGNCVAMTTPSGTFMGSGC